MERISDISEALGAAISTSGALSVALGLILLGGYALLTLGSDRYCRWRRERRNLSRLPTWRCTRCGTRRSAGATRRVVCGG